VGFGCKVQPVFLGSLTRKRGATRTPHPIHRSFSAQVKEKREKTLYGGKIRESVSAFFFFSSIMQLQVAL
jgi:hypothetical protein